MLNTMMRGINQGNQYLVNRRTAKKSDDETSSKNQVTTQAEGEGHNSNLAKSRGLQYVENLQNGNGKVKQSIPYNPNSVQINRNNQIQAQSASPVQKTPLKELPSSKINIAQVIGDFKNTAIAIATPDNLMEEVNTYLGLVDKQVKGGEPDVNIIQTNLRTASNILDKYISKTLNKDSKVVENWIEAIFLQQVNYSYDDKEVNEAFLVKMPESRKGAIAEGAAKAAIKEQQANEQDVKGTEINSELKKLFVSGKKAKTDQEAMSFYQKAITCSEMVQDKETQAKICLEIGKIYDKKDNFKQALESYNKASVTGTDKNVKIKAHLAMGQIYDDVKKYDIAIEHYMTSAAYAGETGNLIAQTQSLTKIANVFADKYDKSAFEVYEDAKTVAKESNDAKVKGYVSSNIANAYNKFNKPIDALRYYSDAVKNYKEADIPAKVAVNYQRAAELMQDYKNPDKAKALYRKALTFASEANNKDLILELSKELATV